VASGNRKQADDSSDHIGPEKWLLDTGSGHDLIGKKDIPIWNREKMMSPCVRPIELHTANGIASVTDEVGIQVMGLHDHASALVLESTPAVLSIGLRCMEQGWSFAWEAGKPPTLCSPTGVITQLTVFGNVPYLVERSPAYPAGAQGSDALGPVLADVPPPAPGQPVEEPDKLIKRKEVRDLKAEAVSLDHLMTHAGNNPYCPSCQRAKTQLKRSARRKPSKKAQATKFNEIVTGMLTPDPQPVEVQVISDKAEGNLKREIEVRSARQAEGDLVADTAKQGGCLLWRMHPLRCKMLLGVFCQGKRVIRRCLRSRSMRCQVATRSMAR